MRAFAAAAVALLALVALLCTGVEASVRSHSDAALQPSAAALAAESQAVLEAQARKPRLPFVRANEALPTELSTMLGSTIGALAQLEVPSLRLDIYTKMRLLGETVVPTQALVNAERTPWHWHLDLLRSQCLLAAEEQERVYQKAKRDLTADAQRRSARAAHNPEAQGLADLSWAMVKAHTDQFLSGKPMVKYLRDHWQFMAHRQRVQVMLTETEHPGQSTNGQSFAPQRITYVLDDRGRVTHLSGYVSPLPNRYTRGGGFGGGLGGAASASPSAAASASPSAMGPNRPGVGAGASASASASSVGSGIGGGSWGAWNYPADGLVPLPAHLPVSPARHWPTLYSQALNVVAGEEYRQWNTTLHAQVNETQAALDGDFGQGYFFPLEFGGPKDEPLNLFPQREYTRREGRWEHAIEWTQELRGYISADHESANLACLRIDQSLHYNETDDRAVVPLWGFFNVSVAESCLFRRYDWKGTGGERPSSAGMRTISFQWSQDEKWGSPAEPVVLPKLIVPYVAPSAVSNGYTGNVGFIQQIGPAPLPRIVTLRETFRPRFAAVDAAADAEAVPTPTAPLSRAQKRKLDKRRK